LRGRLRAFLVADLRAHRIHVERVRLGDHLLERALRQRPRLREDDDLVAENHQRGNRADLEMRGDLLLVVGVDLGEYRSGILLGDALEHRRESAARPAPRRPVVDDDRRVGGDDLLEIFLGQLDNSH
jgi:hypothetical protein